MVLMVVGDRSMDGRLAMTTPCVARVDRGIHVVLSIIVAGMVIVNLSARVFDRPVGMAVKPRAQPTKSPPPKGRRHPPRLKPETGAGHGAAEG
jgi:hypothetical protein